MKYVRNKINDYTREYGNKLVYGLGDTLTKEISKKKLKTTIIAGLTLYALSGPVITPKVYGNWFGDKTKKADKAVKKQVEKAKKAKSEDISKQIEKWVSAPALGVWHGLQGLVNGIKKDPQVYLAIQKIKGYIDPEIRKKNYAREKSGESKEIANRAQKLLDEIDGKRQVVSRKPTVKRKSQKKKADTSSDAALLELLEEL